MTVSFTAWIRAIPRGSVTTMPRPAKQVTCGYEPHEWELMRAFRDEARQAEAAGDKEREYEALLQMVVMHELKFEFEAHVMSPNELAEEHIPPAKPLPEPRRKAEESEVIQTTLLPPEGTESMFKIPEKIRRQLGYDADNMGREAAK